MRQKLVVATTAMLLLIQTFVLVVPSYAATCTVDCGGGNSVSCTGTWCTMTEGVGCSVLNKDGYEVARAVCVN